MNEDSKSAFADNSKVLAASPAAFRNLAILGGLSTLGYGLLNNLSWQFEYASPTQSRPIIAVLAVIGLLFTVYLLAVFYAKRAVQNRSLIRLIVMYAILFRGLMLFSLPIQEVDIYRYMWDGEVAAQQVSPFRFSPEQVLTAIRSDSIGPELNRLVVLREGNSHVREILRRVHFPELPTIYPPISQLVFRAVAAITPNNASVFARVTIMKAWLIAFDVGIVWLLMRLLVLCRLPIGLSLVYAWCPLVLKEIANSGHLDSIAVFFTVLTIYLLVKMFGRSVVSAQQDFFWNLGSVAVVVSLSVATAAKLYPIVLAPIVFVALMKHCGWQKTTALGFLFLGLATVLLWPILPTQSESKQQFELSGASNGAVYYSDSDIPLPRPDPLDSGANETTFVRINPSLGVTTFLKSWEMNDFLFMVIVENLKPVDSNTNVWFSIIPAGLRAPVVQAVSQNFSIPIQETPFMVTRMITMAIFCLLALSLAGGFWRGDKSAADFCEAAFLTLAWFWLLLPTQNPWYWIWALPLLPFARNRAWLAVSGIVMVYYLRFWLDYHFPNTAVLNTGYNGASFFDFVVTWFEFAPWFLWLAAESFRSIRRNKDWRSQLAVRR